MIDLIGVCTMTSDSSDVTFYDCDSLKEVRSDTEYGLKDCELPEKFNAYLEKKVLIAVAEAEKKVIGVSIEEDGVKTDTMVLKYEFLSEYFAMFRGNA